MSNQVNLTKNTTLYIHTAKNNRQTISHTHDSPFCTLQYLKGTRIHSQFLYLMEKSIHYAKITVPQKKLFQNFV